MPLRTSDRLSAKMADDIEAALCGAMNDSDFLPAVACQEAQPSGNMHGASPTQKQLASCSLLPGNTKVHVVGTNTKPLTRRQHTQARHDRHQVRDTDARQRRKKCGTFVTFASGRLSEASTLLTSSLPPRALGAVSFTGWSSLSID